MDVDETAYVNEVTYIGAAWKKPLLKKEQIMARRPNVAGKPSPSDGLLTWLSYSRGIVAVGVGPTGVCAAVSTPLSQLP
jgi:hypothetical protein